MLCEKCLGKGVIRRWLSLMGGDMWADEPCPLCLGLGIVSCCEGSERGGQLPAGWEEKGG